MAERKATIRRRRAIFREATAIIEVEYAQQLDVDLVARRVLTSRRQLQRAFAEIGGTTFRRYVTNIRMRHAVVLLRRGRAPVREVSMRVGYREPSDFAKAFRRHQGRSPSGVLKPGEPRRRSMRPQHDALEFGLDANAARARMPMRVVRHGPMTRRRYVDWQEAA